MSYQRPTGAKAPATPAFVRSFKVGERTLTVSYPLDLSPYEFRSVPAVWSSTPSGKFTDEEVREYQAGMDAFASQLNALYGVRRLVD